MTAITDIMHTMAKWLAAIGLLFMMCMTFADVNLRYWIGQPILGSNEMTEFLLGTIVFSGLVIVSGERSHIVVTLFEPFFERNIPTFYKWLGIVSNLIGIIAVAYLIIRYSHFMYTQGNETEIRHWQWWWLGSLMSVLSVFAVFLAIRSIWAPLAGMAVVDTGADSVKTGDQAQKDQGTKGAAL